jgi:thiamine kinase-like enzyme
MDKKLSNILSNWQQLPLDEQPKFIRTFTAGLNHQTHLVQSGSKQYVLKLFEQPEPSAITVQRWAANHGLAPEIFFANADRDIALMDYVGNATIGRSDISQSTLKSIATALRQLHDLPSSELSMDVGKFDLIQFCETYLKQIETSDTLSPKIHKQLLPALNIFLDDKTQPCICHNDLVTANCFLLENVSEQSVVFIDWEYAQLHNPWFDLAAIIYYCELTPDETQLFLDNYHSGWGDKLATPLEVAAQSSLLWGDMLWHLARGGWSAWPNLEKKFTDLRRLALKLDIEI